MADDPAIDNAPAESIGAADFALCSVTTSDGMVVDVLLRDGKISSIRPAGSASEEPPAVEQIDCSGYIVIPAPAEPHAHLDKALSADRVPNPDGDLWGAIRGWLDYVVHVPKEDFAERANAALEMGLRNGLTTVRTHIDVGMDVELRAFEALMGLKDRWKHAIDLQLVGLTWPVVGNEGADNRARLRAALSAGLDVVGGCPHLESDSATAISIAFDMAAEFGRPVDLHTDENLRDDSLDLEIMAELVLARGFELPVAASHCVSLGIQPQEVQRRVADKVAEAGIGVVVLPQTNLFLQARDHRQAMPRGLTAVAALREAGAIVCAGADNLQDPFCTVGRCDPMETASLMVMAAHLPIADAYDTVSSQVRRVMGLEPVEMREGSVANLLLVRAASLREAVATASPERMVFHKGNLVSAITLSVRR